LESFGYTAVTRVLVLPQRTKLIVEAGALRGSEVL
jgi:hypothetical protein